MVQSKPTSDVIDIDKGCHITNALQEHALALHQMTQGVVGPSDPRILEPLMSSGEVSGTCSSSSSSRNSMRSACVSALTFIENLYHMNAVAFQHCEGMEEQHQSGSTGFGAQVAFVDDYP